VAKRHEKTACNIAPVISGYNQLQYASGWKGSAMAKLIMWNLMTLDGFVEGPNRDISWHFDVWATSWKNCRSSRASLPAG
jgi:hypothetical protein